MAPAELLADVVSRTALVGHVGKSGAALERVTLGDGRTVVVKRVSPETDLTLAIFDQSFAHEFLLWQSGGLDRLPEGVGHAVIDGWTEGEDTTVIVMRDLGDAVLTWEDRLDARTCRWMLERVAALHRAYLGDPPDAVAPLTPALELFAPSRITGLARDGNELLAVALRGWDYCTDPARGRLQQDSPEGGGPTLPRGDRCAHGASTSSKKPTTRRSYSAGCSRRPPMWRPSGTDHS